MKNISKISKGMWKYRLNFLTVNSYKLKQRVVTANSLVFYYFKNYVISTASEMFAEPSQNAGSLL